MKGTLGRVLTLVALAAMSASAQVMPDPKEIAGVPLPVGDVPTGTVTVRVIRGSLSQNLPGQLVELQVNGAARRDKTGTSGRAEFSDLPVGARVRATSVVDGERLESQEFAVPPSGGIRVLLVATDPQAATRAEEDRRLAASAAQPGVVALGEQSRIVFELGDGSVKVFNILQIVNTAHIPVEPPQPVVFEAAPNGGTVTILEGSSPRATAEGRRVSVAGPFAPGTTLVQFAYAVSYSGPTLTIEQRLPVALNQLAVMAQKVGEMQLSSPQIARQREVSAQGETYIVGQGPGVRAGEAVTFSLSGLPYSAAWPRNLALGLAVLILAGGAWSSVRAGSAGAAPVNRSDLEARRDHLFDELTTVEQRRLAATSEAARAASSDRRRALITELESIYAALEH